MKQEFKQGGIEDWEQQLIAEADAIASMKKMLGRPHAGGKRTRCCKLSYKRTQPATVRVRDAAALLVGHAADRPYG